jgi:DNA invertase Pin-like site-specific DNA recombinase
VLRLIGYIRVSTSGQAEDGYGLDVQRDAIHRWANREGHHVVDVLADEGVSGTLPVQDRPGLLEALARVRAAEAEGVVVHRLDRLARLLTVQEATLAALWSAPGRVFEVSGGEVLEDDPDDPARTALRQVLGTFSQFERGSVIARMRAGKRLKGERGGFVGGAPPYGWNADGGELVVDPREQLALDRLGQLRAAGHSLREVGRLLLQEGHRPKRAGLWHPETLRQMELRSAAQEPAAGSSAASGGTPT